jgi:flagellar biogenesis protein FliO
VPETATKILRFLKARLGILEERYTQHRAKKKLRLRETLSLGNKRFLAVVEYQHQEILIAGTASSITVLMTAAQLDRGNTAADSRISKDCLQ